MKIKGKICFQMMGVASGVGGHHYSARDLGRALREYGYSVEFLMLGSGTQPNSKAYAPADKLTRFAFSLSRLSTISDLKAWYRSHDFDAIFCLDELSCRIALVYHPLTQQRVIPIKPGWINSDAWTQACLHFINFSKENYDYFVEHKGYNETQLHLIPNRVGAISRDVELEGAFSKLIGLEAGQRLLLAASRIHLGDHRDFGKRYVFESALEMFKSLKMYEAGWRLVFVGNPTNEKSLLWINDLAANELGVSVVTDSKYTSNLSKLFPVSDVVVAMGRTLMESLSVGSVGMVPVEGHRFPLAVTSDTFSVFSYHNFTHRAKEFSDSSLLDADEFVEGIISSSEALELAKVDSKEIFDYNLSVNGALRKYASIIDDVSSATARIRFGIWIYSLMRVLGVFLISWWRKRRSTR